MSSPSWDYIAKLVCIGDSGCGKSSLTIRLCEGRFSAQHDVTIGVEFGSRIVPVGPPHSTTSRTGAAVAAADPSTPADTSAPAQQQQQKHMKLSLWDTAGQETYKSVTRSYFRGASGALLVFDITRRSTFEHATDWLSDLRQIAEPDIVVVLVGNKLDQTQPGDPSDPNNLDPEAERAAVQAAEARREVSTADAREWARRNGVLTYVETSAKSGENVEAAFAGVAERIFDNINAGKYDLNDRRSGVKGPGSGAGGPGGRSVKLSSDAARQGAAGGCC